MVALYNRATPQQQRILRAVEGAVKNAADAHPEIKVSPRHRRSIAKRAAGTLTAQWPEVLAAQPSEKAGHTTGRPASSDLGGTTSRGALTLAGGRAPLGLRRLRDRIVREMYQVKASENLERAKALMDVLRWIAELGIRK